MLYRWSRFGVPVLVGSLWLSGCGGGSEAASSAEIRNSQGVVISGSVIDGPVIDATIEVVSADGVVVAQAVGDATASFHVLVPPNTAYPVRLRARDGIDLVTDRAPDFRLETIIADPAQAVAHLTPLSTFTSRIAACADQRVDAKHLNKVWELVLGELGMGYDAEQLGHPATAAIGAPNFAELALASEALGEVVRRTRDARAGLADWVDGDGVIAAVACDLAADSRLDGLGTAASSRVAAVFRAAAGGVLLEVIGGRLRVDGTAVSARLDAAIARVNPEAAARSVTSVAPTAQLVRQARNALAPLLGHVAGDAVPRHLALLDQTALAALPVAVASALGDAELTMVDDWTAQMADADQTLLDAVAAVVTRPPPARLPALSFAANPTDIAPGASTRLTWASADAAACVAAGGWSGEQALSGSAQIELAASTRFRLTCVGLGGSVTQEVAVSVAGVPPPAAPTVDLTSPRATVAVGATFTLNWVSTDATQCTAAGGWAGARPPQGSVVVGPLAATQSYSLSCSGPGGTGFDSVTVALQAPAPTPVPPPPAPPPPAPVSVSLQVSPTWIPAGGSVTITWDSQGATGCVGSGGWSGSRAPSGTATRGPLAADTTFTLTCTGPGGSAVSSRSVMTRTARLSWLAPNGDTTPDGVTGYRLFYGTAPRTYGSQLDLNDPDARSHTLSLSPGTFYFAVAPLTVGGAQGALSNEASKTIR